MAKVTTEKDTFWFKHDSNVRNDLKIVKLRREMGREASDVYFDIVCLLREQKDYRMSLDNISDIAYDLRFDEEKVKKIVNDYDLFQIKSGYFFSQRLVNDMKAWEEKKSKRRAAGSLGGIAKAQQKSSIATNLLEQNPSNALAKEKRREEKSKEDKIILTEQFDFFWNVYDKSVDKSKCKKKFDNLPERDRLKIIETVKTYVKHTPEIKFRKNPLTWLNGSCWNDVEAEAEILPRIKTRSDFWNEYQYLEWCEQNNVIPEPKQDSAA